MLEKVVTQLGFAPPLADMLYRDPYRAVRGNVQYGFDLGVADVNGQSCHALAFVQKDIDWQIWISDGAATDAVQGGHHIQDTAVAAAVHRGVHRLGLRATHRHVGIHAGGAGGAGEDSVRNSLWRQIEVGSMSMFKRLSNRKQLTGVVLAGVAMVACLAIGADRAAAFRGGGFGGGGFRGGGGFHAGGFAGGGFHGGVGGFRGGGFAGGAARFGGGGLFDRGGDAGFGAGGWGSVHNASTFSDRADGFQQSHPEVQQDHPDADRSASQVEQDHPDADRSASQVERNHPDADRNASEFQQNRLDVDNNVSKFQQNHPDEANSLQQNRFNEANSLQRNRFNET